MWSHPGGDFSAKPGLFAGAQRPGWLRAGGQRGGSLTRAESLPFYLISQWEKKGSISAGVFVGFNSSAASRDRDCWAGPSFICQGFAGEPRRWENTSRATQCLWDGRIGGSVAWLGHRDVSPGVFSLLEQPRLGCVSRSCSKPLLPQS